MALSLTSSPSTPLAPAHAPVRVMVCDDSAVIRSIISRSLEGEPDIKVVSSAANGQMAVDALKRDKVDIIVLDIEMPVMDGITAIPLLLAVHPGVQIIMASTLTLKNADISMRAIQAGAADYVPKPSSIREIEEANSFKHDLIQKVRTLGAVARRKARLTAGASVGAPSTPVRAVTPPAVITLRPLTLGRVDIIAIGSSTGGPKALFEVLASLKGGLRQPLLITQHMPPTFTTILAEHISRQCGIACTEAKDGEPILGGHAYLAPGDIHMLVASSPQGPVIALSKDPPENFCRPAVDPMMRSIVRHYGPTAAQARGILAVILTGMGSDGMLGCKDLIAAGGTVVAQDEASSVVWGMPGAVAKAGLCSAILPLAEIGPFIHKASQRTAA